MTEQQSTLHSILAAITRAWRTRNPDAMTEYLHPDIIMALPGFQGNVTGRAALIDSFKEFCENAGVIEYEEHDESIDVVGNVAIASFRFMMVYERAAYREKSTGRDIWVFEDRAGRWVGVWRTMTELHEERIPSR